MNGRCETDPFDRAVDVCRMCHGEFCWTCLVETRGKQQPLCRECALIVGGLRPKAKPKIRGDKKTAKARREHLLQTRDQPRSGTGFTYFDVGDPFEEKEPALIPGGGRRKDDPEPSEADSKNDNDKNDENNDNNNAGGNDATDDGASPAGVSDSPAVRRLASIRRTDPTPSTTAATPATHSPSTTNPAAAATLAPQPAETGAEGQPGPEPGKPPAPSEDHRLDDEEALVAEFRKPRRYIDQQARSPKHPQPEAPDQTAAPDRRAEPPPPEAPPPQPAPAPAVEANEPAPAPAVAAHEPVHIHDDPWARNGPEAVGTTSLPKRRPDPRPSDDTSEDPPEWTKAKLPRRR